MKCPECRSRLVGDYLEHTTGCPVKASQQEAYIADLGRLANPLMTGFERDAVWGERINFGLAGFDDVETVKVSRGPAGGPVAVPVFKVIQ